MNLATTRGAWGFADAVDGCLRHDITAISPWRDQVEAIGVDRTRREAADSDLLIVVIDGSQPLTAEDLNAIEEAANHRHVIALNKSDLETFSETRIEKESNALIKSPSVVSVSAKTGEGLASLRTALLQPFDAGDLNGEGLMITNARHHDLLLRAIDAMKVSESLLEQHASEELTLVGLHDALRYLGQISGETSTEQLLGEIFSTFCIGK